MHRRSALLAAFACLLFAAGSAMAAEITIYRCTDAQGQLALRDTPCRKGETQQTKEMQRPKDAPRSRARAPAAAAATATPDTTATPTRYVVMAPPQPMYECTTPDGNRYLSDTHQGNPRWVPLWTLGYPVAVPYTRYDSGFHARVGGEFNGGDGRYDVRVGDRPMRPPPPPVDTAITYGAGTWVYDECHALPQEEVCDRLRDERWALGRRYNSALQSERAEIDRQQRGIDARLGRDCGGT